MPKPIPNLKRPYIRDTGAECWAFPAGDLINCQNRRDPSRQNLPLLDAVTRYKLAIPLDIHGNPVGRRSTDVRNIETIENSNAYPNGKTSWGLPRQGRYPTKSGNRP